MQDIRFQKKSIFLYYFLFSISIFIFGLYLFYLQATQQITSDVILHLNFIDPIVSGKLTIPHEGFEYSVYALAKLFNSSYVIASALFLSFIIVIMSALKFFLLKCLTNVPANLALFFSIALMVVSAIYLPRFNSNFYLGQGSPTVWHNPTLLCIKPLAFLCVYFVIIALESFNRKLCITLSSLLLISFFYKPSFGIVFIPALGIYVLYNYTKNLFAYLLIFFMILPSLLFAIVFQLPSWIIQPETHNSIIFSPFGVLHLYTSNAFISFVLATAFPLFFLLFNPKGVLANHYLFLSWLMLIIGYIQFAFLAETQCFSCANFSWGFLIALDLVFFFSFIEFIHYIKEAMLTLKSTLIISGLWMLFFMHLISGVVYLGSYILTGSYF